MEFLSKEQFAQLVSNLFNPQHKTVSGKSQENVIKELLHIKYPNVFMGRGQEKLPLKIGIRQDIEKATGLPKRPLGRALFNYTNGEKYIKHLVEGADRYDLDGNPCGKVTAEEAQVAKRNMKKIAERRKAQQNQRNADEKTIMEQQAAQSD